MIPGADFAAGVEAAGAPLALSDLEVTLVGAGRSGSQIALILAMLGVRLRVYDFDRLGPENQGRQLYRRSDVVARREKVRALRRLVRAIVPWAVFRAHAERFEAGPEHPHSPIVVVAVDTMAERRALWDRLADTAGLCLLIDARLGRGQLRLHEVFLDQPAAVTDYEASLHDDPADGDAAVCGEDASVHAAAAAAALVAGALRAFVAGWPRPAWTAVDLDRAQWLSGPLAGGIVDSHAPPC